MRSHIASNLDTIVKIQWHPGYRSTSDLLCAVKETHDPLFVREARHRDRLQSYIRLFPEWKQHRLPPPNQAQSEVGIHAGFLQMLLTILSMIE